MLLLAGSVPTVLAMTLCSHSFAGSSSVRCGLGRTIIFRWWWRYDCNTWMYLSSFGRPVGWTVCCSVPLEFKLQLWYWSVPVSAAIIAQQHQATEWDRQTSITAFVHFMDHTLPQIMAIWMWKIYQTQCCMFRWNKKQSYMFKRSSGNLSKDWSTLYN